MASLDDLDTDTDDNDSPAESKGGTTPALREGTTSPTLVGDPHAAASPEAQKAAEAPAPRMEKARPARTRAGKGGNTKDGGGEKEGSKGEEEGNEPFILPSYAYRPIVEEAARDAALKAKQLVLEDEDLRRQLISETMKLVTEGLASAKAEEAERTPTLAAIETSTKEVTDGEVLEVIGPLPTEKEKAKTTETVKTKKSDDNDWGFHLTVIAIIIFVAGLVGYAVYPRSPEREEADETTNGDRSDAGEEEDAGALSSAQQIAPAPSASATTAEIAAFTARVPYSRTERLNALRRLRGTGLEDNRDMDCGGTGMNFSTRALISRETASGTDTRLLTQAEALAYFADESHTGEHTIDAIEGPRHYTVYLDLRDRAGEPGHCEFFIINH